VLKNDPNRYSATTRSIFNTAAASINSSHFRAHFWVHLDAMSAIKTGPMAAPIPRLSGASKEMPITSTKAKSTKNMVTNDKMATMKTAPIFSKKLDHPHAAFSVCITG
jgi:hypothetical protein